MSQFDATTTCPANLNLPEVLPLLRFTVTGLPRYTLSRGTVLWGPNGGQSQPGHGQHVKRPTNPPVSRAYSQWRDLIAPRAIVRDENLMPIGV